MVGTPVKRNEVNYTLDDVNGGQGLRARAEHLLPFTGEVPKPFTGEHPRRPVAQVTDVPITPNLWPGTVVRYAGKTGLFVVVASGTRPNTYRVFPLGGSDRYWKNVPQRLLTVIDPAKITVAA